ncbi:putative O-methyltransferase [Yersinia nurmii]|uniref:O-methyltransferase n=1 Tax=Yersinia nurmii TaxID=685706 RepID=A0ABP1YDK2_9GAMM|nr:putative O-methyltransferase [Yersinia nurmii]
MNSNVSICEKDAAGIHLLEQAMGFTYQGALRAAAILGVADHLIKGAKTTEELSNDINVDSQELYRVLRMLASRDIFEEMKDGKFALTPAARFLCSDGPDSLRHAVLMLTDETLWGPSGNMVENLRGKSAFKNIFGTSFYEYWSQDHANEVGYSFHTGMSSMSTVENRFLIRSYDFPENVTVVDIAGGMGGLLLNVLRSNPTLHGILFDRPEVLETNRLGELGDDSRWKLQPGSFFESCPTADIYLLKYIVMDWPDEQARKILKCCRKAMRPDSKILIMEAVIPEDNSWHGGKELDMLLLASFDGGQSRSEEQLRELLASADLKLNRVIDTGCYVSIVEAVIG